MAKKRAAAGQFSPARRTLTTTHLAWLLHNKPELAKLLKQLDLKLTSTGRLLPTKAAANPMGSSCRGPAGMAAPPSDLIVKPKARKRRSR